MKSDEGFHPHPEEKLNEDVAVLICWNGLKNNNHKKITASLETNWG